MENFKSWESVKESEGYNDLTFLYYESTRSADWVAKKMGLPKNYYTIDMRTLPNNIKVAVLIVKTPALGRYSDWDTITNSQFSPAAMWSGSASEKPDFNSTKGWALKENGKIVFIIDGIEYKF